MANHKSAKKRAVQNVVKAARNRSYLSMVKSAVKKFRTSMEVTPENGGKLDKDKSRELLVAAQSALGKATSKGLIHSNTTSRKLSRLNKMYVKTFVQK